MTREEAIKYLSEEQKKTEEVVALTERDFGVSESVWHTEYEAFALAISALGEQPRWISVEERLPNDNEKVIVYTRSGKMCVARWSARQDKFVSSGNLTVTHWMLLPNEPKTEVRCEFAENGVNGG